MSASTQRYLDLVGGRSRGLFASMARGGLWLASGPYGAAMRIRNAAFDRGWRRVTRATVPVISVGNLTLGGTGKTPAVEYIARHFRARDIRVAILSRGYGGAGGPNDEALMLEENLPDVPHLQGADRVALAAMAVEELESELLILDDGFQHRRLARDLDVVLVDATDPWGLGHLVPRGLLREPRSGLRRAGAVLMTRCDQAGQGAVDRVRGEIEAIVRPGTPIVESTHQPLEWLRDGHGPLPADALAGRTAAAFCGIGRPDAFRATLESLGIKLIEMKTYPDHHAYNRGDIDALRTWSASLPAGAVVLTTQKDLVKLRLADLAGRELLALRVGLAMENTPDPFSSVLDRLIPDMDAV